MLKNPICNENLSGANILLQLQKKHFDGVIEKRKMIVRFEHVDEYIQKLEIQAYFLSIYSYMVLRKTIIYFLII